MNCAVHIYFPVDPTNQDFKIMLIQINYIQYLTH